MLRTRIPAALIALTLTFTSLAATASAQAATKPIDTSTGSSGSGGLVPPKESRYDPAEVGRTCANVGGGKTKVSLYSSKGKTASQIHPSRGDYVPVLMVHGWTGSSAAWLDAAKFSSPGYAGSELSIVGKLQAIPGAAVYGYDYSKTSGVWVTSTQVHLAAAITCLSKQTKRKVIVVTHSMGGLNARLAVHEPGVAKRVSEIINFGTPVLGSTIARDVWAFTGEKDDQQGVARWNLTAKSQIQQFFRDYLFSCGQRGGAGDLEACKVPFDVLPSSLVTNFQGEAGRRLRVNGDPIKKLAERKWPAGIKIYSLYGNLDLGYLGTSPVDKTAMVGWIGILDSLSSDFYKRSAKLEPERAKPLDLKHPGDLIVPTDSAVYDTPAKNRYSIRCAPYDSDTSDDFHSTMGNDVMQSPCFHGNLYRSPKLIKYAAAKVRRQVNAEIVPWKDPRLKGTGTATGNCTAAQRAQLPADLVLPSSCVALAGLGTDTPSTTPAFTVGEVAVFANAVENPTSLSGYLEGKRRWLLKLPANTDFAAPVPTASGAQFAVGYIKESAGSAVADAKRTYMLNFYDAFGEKQRTIEGVANSASMIDYVNNENENRGAAQYTDSDFGYVVTGSGIYYTNPVDDKISFLTAKGWEHTVEGGWQSTPYGNTRNLSNRAILAFDEEGFLTRDYPDLKHYSRAASGTLHFLTYGGEELWSTSVDAKYLSGAEIGATALGSIARVWYYKDAAAENQDGEDIDSWLNIKTGQPVDSASIAAAIRASGFNESSSNSTTAILAKDGSIALQGQDASGNFVWTAYDSSGNAHQLDRSATRSRLILSGAIGNMFYGPDGLRYSASTNRAVVKYKNALEATYATEDGAYFSGSKVALYAAQRQN